MIINFITGTWYIDDSWQRITVQHPRLGVGDILDMSKDCYSHHARHLIVKFKEEKYAVVNSINVRVLHIEYKKNRGELELI